MAIDNTRRSRYSFPARHRAAVDLFRRCNWRTCSAHDQCLTWRLSPGCCCVAGSSVHVVVIINYNQQLVNLLMRHSTVCQCSE